MSALTSQPLTIEGSALEGSARLMELRQSYPHCPLCTAPLGKVIGEFDCRNHALYSELLPSTLRWLRCLKCGHVHTDGYWSEHALGVLQAKAHATQLAGDHVEQKRLLWAPVVQKIFEHLGTTDRTFEERRKWLDAGCGDGALIMTAAEFGFDALGLDSRSQAVDRITALGYNAVKGDLLRSASSQLCDVISLADVLEHLPFPVAGLKKGAEMLKKGGVLFISCPNMDCAAWRAMDATGSNPYWKEIEHYHNFSRSLLMTLMRSCGIHPVHYGVSLRYRAGMDIVGIKTSI